MPDIPDSIDIAALNSLLKLSDEPGVRPVSSKEFKVIANEMIQEMDAMLSELSSYTPDNILHSRWDYVNQSRRSLRNSLRLLRKSIQC